MNVGMISKRYAKALYEYAKEQKAEEAVYAEMKKLADGFMNEPRLRMAMDNPTLTKTDKLKLIKAAIGGKKDAVLDQFFGLVLKNRREVYLQSIALSYKDIYCEEKQINTAKLITASPVDKHVIEKVKGLLQGIKSGTLEFETKVDPDTEGGFILFIDTYRLDASVKTQLSRIRKQFILENSKIV